MWVPSQNPRWPQCRIVARCTRGISLPLVWPRRPSTSSDILIPPSSLLCGPYFTDNRLSLKEPFPVSSVVFFLPGSIFSSSTVLASLELWRSHLTTRVYYKWMALPHIILSCILSDDFFAALPACVGFFFLWKASVSTILYILLSALLVTTFGQLECAFHCTALQIYIFI